MNLKIEIENWDRVETDLQHDIYDFISSYQENLFNPDKESIEIARPHVCYVMYTPEQTLKQKLFKLEPKSEIAGVCLFRFITDTLVKTQTKIVSKRFRRQGVGTSIDRSIEFFCRRNDVKKITCNIYHNNLPNIFAKLKQRYFIEAFLRHHDDEDMHEYIVSKFL